MEYAAAEDGIRVLWEQLLKAHQKFLVSCSIVCASGFGLQNCVCQTFSEKKHEIVVKGDKEREKGQVRGMATSKKAAEGTFFLYVYPPLGTQC